MDNQFMLLPVDLLNQLSTTAIRECNTYTNKFGLQLAEEEIHQLVIHRKVALEQNGRVEFGGGVSQKIIMEFADSSYLLQEDYLSTLMELQECFYYFKREAMEELSDDELIKLMKSYYEDVCQGSIDFLKSTMLENYSRDIRFKSDKYRHIDGYEDNYIEFLDWDEKQP